MALRNLYQFFTRSRVESYEVVVWFSMGAGGAPTLLTSAGNPGLVTSVTDAGTGDVLVTLKDTFPATISAHITLAGEPNSSGADGFLCQLGEIVASSGTVHVLNFTKAGVAVDFAEDVIVCLTLKFSSTSQIG